MTATIEATSQTMKFRENEIGLAVVSLFFLILSLVGVVWTFTSGLIGTGIDGIMLLGVALLMAGVFALQLLFIARDSGMITFPQIGPPKKAAPAAKPAAPAAAATPAPAAAPAPKPAPPPPSTEAK
jgi:hypothetical protein